MNKHFLLSTRYIRYDNGDFSDHAQFMYAQPELWEEVAKYRSDGQVFHTLDQKYKKNIKKLMGVK